MKMKNVPSHQGTFSHLLHDRPGGANSWSSLEGQMKKIFYFSIDFYFLFDPGLGAYPIPPMIFTPTDRPKKT